MEIAYFDGVASVGAHMLEVIGGAPAAPALNRYLELLRETYSVMAQIHDGLIDVTIEVALADSMAEAAQALARLNNVSLRSTMKAQELCDTLGRLGAQLRLLPPEVLQGLTEPEKDAWLELCTNLEDREAATSRLYDQKLMELRALPSVHSDLALLKAEVKAASDQLVVQKGEFERLAKHASAMVQRRPL
jgi:hypothetical protein